MHRPIKPFKRLSSQDSLLFDFLRGGSAQVVLLHHIYQIVIEPLYFRKEISRISYSASAYAVMVFFVVSGYMVASSMYSNASRHSFNDFDLGRFAKERMLRLYPPLLFSTALLLLLYLSAYLSGFLIHHVDRGAYSAAASWSMEKWSVMASLLFLQNISFQLSTPAANTPLWSLSHEFWFYILGVCIFSILLGRRKFAFPLLVAFLALSTSDNGAQVMAGFGVWLAGAAVFYFHHSGYLRPTKSLAAILLCIAVVISVTHTATVVLDAQLVNTKYIVGFIFALICAALLAWSPHGSRNATERPAFRLIARTSRFSYTLYLIHWPLLMLSLNYLRPYAAKGALELAVTAILLFAFVSLIARSAAHILEDRDRLKAIWRGIRRFSIAVHSA